MILEFMMFNENFSSLFKFVIAHDNVLPRKVKYQVL